MAKSVLENLVPAWTNLVSVIVTLIVTALGVYYSMTPSTTSGGISAGSIAYVVLTYIPHIMLLFGVLADMFTYEGVYSIPSIVGLLSIPLNFIFKYFWKGLDDIFEMGSKLNAKTTPTQQGGMQIDYSGCEVQGFEGLRSEYVPQTLVVTATIFFYYIFDLLNNRGLINSLASILIGSMLYIGESIIISNCNKPEDKNQTGILAGAIRGLVEGAFFGGTAYSVVQAYYPARLPSAAISPFPRRNPSDLKPGEDGRMYDSEGNAYVILPNGQTVPDLSTNTDRKKMAEYVGETLGTGGPAKTSSCSA